MAKTHTTTILAAWLTWFHFVPSAAQDARSDEAWICVPAEDGGWACGDADNVPQAAPLPAPPTTPVTGIPPSLLAPTRPAARFGQNPARPPSSPPREPGPARFTLQIASVSSPADVVRFAQDYDLDLDRVRYASVVEDGSARHLILWGEFETQRQAQGATVSLPQVVRLIRPQVVAITSIGAPLKPVRAASLVQQAPPPATTGDSQAGQQAPPPRVAATSQQPASKPTRANGLDTASTADKDATATPSRRPLNRITPPPATPPPVATAQSRPARTQAPRLDTQASTPTAQQSRPPSREAQVQAATTTQPKLAADLAQLNQRWYTIQLASLSDIQASQRYIQQHGLDIERLYRIEIDEGAGPRWLLLFGAYASLKEASQAQASLPTSVRSPWVRRIAPLQRRIGNTR